MARTIPINRNKMAKSAGTDQSAVVQRARDQATRDQATRDQATLDQTTPDQATPDQATPDQATLNQAARLCATSLLVNGIKLLHNDNEYYMSWRPVPALSESLGINATFARTLNIKEGDKVVVSSISNPPFLSSITVTPWNVEDWDIVACQADRIQSVLLDQISLIAKSQSIVVWISKGLSVTLSIDAINPGFLFGRIGNRTEVHVSLPTVEEHKINFSKTEKSRDQMKNKIWNFFQKIPLITSKSEIQDMPNDIETWMKKNENPTFPKVFRVCSLSALKEFYPLDVFSHRDEFLYDVFVRNFDVPSNYANSDDAKFRLYKIRKVHEDRQYVNATSTNFLQTEKSIIPKQSTELVVRLFVLQTPTITSNNEENLNLTLSVHNEIYVSTNLRRNLKLLIGSKVILEPAESLNQSVKSIAIFPSAQSVTRKFFQEFLMESAYENEILLNSRSRIYFKNGTSCMVSCWPEKSSYLLLDAYRLENFVMNVKNVTTIESDDTNDIEKELGKIDMAAISLRPLELILAECQFVLELSLGLAGARNIRYEPGNILICGQVGVGKTTFCRILRENMEKAPHFVHIHVIECKALKGKRAEAMHKIISAAMADCVYYQPSILFFDDLESITSSPSGEEENTPDAINASRILDVIFNISAEYQSSHYVSIVATCTNMNKIGQKLKSPRGVHLFRSILTIQNFSKDHRLDILRLFLQKNTNVPEAINLDFYGNKTEGWVAQDLVDFAEKAAFAAWKRHVKTKTPVTLAEEDLSETLKNYKTISLHGVQLYKSCGHDWSHIGGLTKVKEILTQLLKWPLKYPELYRNAPIKNQNGVLLYGMPGTGKTILAGAIAKECGVNLISVKGPELLSKYIGASEEAVRNVFERARRAKPCVLFFDEFDSLAPRRGHDSTGVTDRVVNQLLTQLDGVEGREGVAVVAASSRPDMLDPALLRPGRLDKLLLCPLPDEHDREAILVTLCKAQSIDAMNFDLKNLAKRSTGFTGADLNAVLTQAKYDALEDAIGNVSSGQDKYIEEIEITQKHLIESLKATNPSLSMTEKEKYRRIYDQFSMGGIHENIAFMKQKATLA